MSSEEDLGFRFHPVPCSEHASALMVLRAALAAWAGCVAGVSLAGVLASSHDSLLVVGAAAASACAGALVALVAVIRGVRWLAVTGLVMSMVTPFGYLYPVLMIPLILLIWLAFGWRGSKRTFEV